MSDEFRAQARAWLQETLATLPDAGDDDWDARLVQWRAFQQAVHGAGYAGLAWPQEYGGRGASVVEQAIWTEELNRAGAPEPLNGIGEKLAGPTIIEFGTEAQKRRYLPSILSGEEVWCQLFSEPQAGSDLAGLQTRAERCDGGFRISGQKVWTSRAQVSDRAILLARTGGAPRHGGITYFLLPMRQEGVTVVPLRQMTGDSEFNEVFLDGAAVADDEVLGAVDDGWRVARATLQYERAFVAMGRVDFGRWFEELLEDVRAAGSGGDPLVRQRVARAFEHVLVQQVTAQRVLRRIDRGEAAGPESSVGKLTLSALLFELADLGCAVCGADGLADPDLAAGERGARWQKRALMARGMAIAGGTPQIQRTILAERVLGLPRG